MCLNFSTRDALRARRRCRMYILCVYIYLCAVFGVVGCGQREGGESVTHPAETAMRISHVTSGVISSGEQIRVRFVQPVVAENLTGQPLVKRVFAFVPEVDGVARWEDRQTLIFTPNAPLSSRRRYSGKLDLAALMPLQEGKRPEPLAFQFAVGGREVASVSGEFGLLKEEDPRDLVYRGMVVFTEQTPMEAVERAASLEMDTRRVRLSWESAGDGQTFRFVTPKIERGRVEKRFVLKVRKSPLDLSGDYEKAFVLAPFQEMRVVGVRRKEDGDRPRIAVEFSDDLDAGQDVAGLIAVEPIAQVQVKRMGKTAVVGGDFRYGSSYRVTVYPGIRSRWGTATGDAHVEEVAFSDLKPQIRFARDGVYLPSSEGQRLRFATLNLSRVRLEIKRVFESNLGQFLQSERLSSGKDRRRGFNDYYVNRVGVLVAQDTLQIGQTRNEWLHHELDLTKILRPEEKGPFLISLSFRQEDMLYGSAEDMAEAMGGRRRYRGQDYFSHPFSPGYLHAHGRVYKPVIVSDIGLTCKKTHGRYLVYATRVDDASPMAGVQVTLRTYQNQVIARQVTDRDGRADFSDIEQTVFYIEAEKDGQRSIIKPDEMAWNLSTFDTAGEVPAGDGTRAFIYTERGVYRPGDEVNLCVIARNEDGTFPDNHPVTLKVRNPRDQVVFEQTVTDARDGFTHFRFVTDPQDPTGNWRAQALVGSRIYDHTVKIETVVPYRLKVRLQPEAARLGPGARVLRLVLNSTYLFGGPAAGLQADAEVTLKSDARRFPRYEAFSFVNEAVDYHALQSRIFEGRLDSAGSTRVTWQLPSLDGMPSAGRAVVTARVLEKGGRPNRGTVSIPIDPYPYYAGLKKPAFDFGYTRVGSAVQVAAVLVDPLGNAVAGRPLNCRVYKGTLHWWWEYENRDAFRLRFKSDRNTELKSESELISQDVPVMLDFTPEDGGEYLIEVQEGSETGHTAAFFVRAYPWGNVPVGDGDAGTLALRSDRQSYAPGETATVSFPVPQEGNILLSVEKGTRLLHSRWHRPDGKQEMYRIQIPMTAEMMPTAYVSVSVIQPYRQTLNDRPMRMYGVLPLNVIDASTRQELSFRMPGTLRPGAPFDVEVQTADRAPTQLTVAVVDEGLLDLTRFETPSPWQAFFRKLGLGVRTFDLFSHIIGANKGDVFKTFSIGGGVGEARSGAEPGARRRFPAVSMFSGPVMTDAEGRASFRFDMPEYVGSVRVMAVCARGNRYGSAEKTVAVRSDLMVLPTLPRVLGPGDRITVPVTVFALADGIGDVSVSLDTQGPVEVVGASSQTVRFAGQGEQDVAFALRARAAAGAARIAVTAAAGGAVAVRETDIEVRPSSPRVYRFEEKEIRPGEGVSFTVPGDGISGTNRARLSLRRRPNLKFAHRLLWLIGYPYGCIEQVVSSAFPQLYLKAFLTASKNPRQDERDIDAHINAAIRKLRTFRLPSGAFTYWPGNREASIWGSLYAGHFMIEASQLGYHVPEDLMADWLRCERSLALTTRDKLTVRVYRAYLLALAGEPQVGPMNLLKENSLKDMVNVEKWMLASAYKLAGADRAADEVLRGIGTEVDAYAEFAGTYGCRLRDRAIILEALVRFERWREADAVANELALTLSSESWYSTQATGFMLLAMGKYLHALEGGSDQKILMAGEISFPEGEALAFETEDFSQQFEITQGFGGDIGVRLDERSTVARAFATLEWDGIPLKGEAEDLSRNLALTVEWVDEDGMRIDPAETIQGKAFWGHIQVRSAADVPAIEEVALTQMLPAGWEVENVRLSGAAMPGWMAPWRLNREDYMDIRDDRVVWFFDLRQREPLDFAVKLNAVTTGEFALPPTAVEAMYDSDYRAVRAGKKVTVRQATTLKE